VTSEHVSPDLGFQVLMSACPLVSLSACSGKLDNIFRGLIEARTVSRPLFCHLRRRAPAVALLMALMLLGLAPLGATLELHHLLAAADADGHQHSDADLCQWVQAHTASSAVSTLPVLAVGAATGSHEWPSPISHKSAHALAPTAPRGPPLV
jgi:hypothetical protein